MRKEKGITLIALVVTIIVLIILAGISINLVLGDNGIIIKAKQASEKYKVAEIDEKLQFVKANVEFNNLELTIENYLNQLNKEKDLGFKVTSVENIDENNAYITIDNQYKYLLKHENKDIKIMYQGMEEGNREPDNQQPGDQEPDNDPPIVEEPTYKELGDATVVFSGETSQNTEKVTIVATVTFANEEQHVNIQGSKWKLNKSNEEIGTDLNDYNGTFNTDGENIDLIIEETGDYFLHVLTVGNDGNKKETIKGPIKVTGLYHTHVSECYHVHTGNEIQKTGCYANGTFLGTKICGAEIGNSWLVEWNNAWNWQCNNGHVIGNNSAAHTSSSRCQQTSNYYAMACDKTEEVIECGKTEETIESYSIQY